MHVKPNEWYSYLTEKRTSTVTLLINLIIAITLVDVIKNLHTFIFFLYTYRLARQKRPRIPLLTKLDSTADQVFLDRNPTTF